MKKQIIFGTTIVAGFLFTSAQADANTINIEGYQKHELVQNNQNIAKVSDNSSIENLQIQSSTTLENNEYFSDIDIVRLA